MRLPATGTDRNPTSANEQRDQLANVRTLLSWVRTAITVMGLGFVVAKFGIILDQLPGHHNHLGIHLAAILGTLLVLAGAGLLVLALTEYRAVGQAIAAGKVHVGGGIYVMLTAVLVIVALVLAFYLVATG